jgi:integrase
VLLTAARRKEIVQARWRHLDLKEGYWIVPKHKTDEIMGAGERPISSAMLRLLDELRQRVPHNAENFLFPGDFGSDAHLSEDAAAHWYRVSGKEKWRAEFERLFPDWNYERSKKNNEHPIEFHMHGFRSTCNAWSMSQGYPEYLWDLQVFHKIGNEVKSAYTHDPQFEARRKMMEDYGRFCHGVPEEPPEKKIVNLVWNR